MNEGVFSGLWAWLEALPMSEHIAISWWFPLLESIHVVAITLLVGAILMVDLRLVGWAGLRVPASRMVSELTPWAWGAFALSLPTGFGMFMTRAAHYAGNPAFRIKLILLLLAGLNMAIFQRLAKRDMDSWESDSKTPSGARRAGGLSLILWCGVILAGRWIGHT